MCWSTIGAFGAVTGGAICSLFGVKTAFVVDILSFLLVAILISYIPRDYGNINTDDDVCANNPSINETAEIKSGSKFDLNKQNREAKLSSGEIKIILPEENRDFSTDETQNKFSMIVQAYQFLKSEPRVLALCCIKGCGALIWGASDLLQVNFSRMNSMHSLGDQSVTLGVLYSMVGLGCQLGPLLWNNCTPQEVNPLLKRVVSAFLNLFSGHLIASFAHNIFMVMASTVSRSFGSSVLWTYSTLLIQISVPTGLQGRMFAFERAVYVILSIISYFGSGCLFDYANLNEWEVGFVMFCVGAGMFIFWLLLYILCFSEYSIVTPKNSKIHIIYSALSVLENSFDAGDDDFDDDDLDF